VPAPHNNEAEPEHERSAEADAETEPDPDAQAEPVAEADSAAVPEAGVEAETPREVDVERDESEPTPGGEPQQREGVAGAPRPADSGAEGPVGMHRPLEQVRSQLIYRFALAIPSLTSNSSCYSNCLLLDVKPSVILESSQDFRVHNLASRFLMPGAHSSI